MNLNSNYIRFIDLKVFVYRYSRNWLGLNLVLEQSCVSHFDGFCVSCFSFSSSFFSLFFSSWFIGPRSKQEGEVDVYDKPQNSKYEHENKSHEGLHSCFHSHGHLHVFHSVFKRWVLVSKIIFNSSLPL